MPKKKEKKQPATHAILAISGRITASFFESPVEK